MSKIVLQVLADSNGLIKGLDQAQSAVKEFMKSADSAGQSLGGGVNRALTAFKNLSGGGAAAAGVLAGAFVAASTAAVAFALVAGKHAEELEQLKAITDISTDTLQEYEVVLHRANLTGQDLVPVMKAMSNSLDQARQGTGSAADRFRQLGIDIRTVTSTDDLIRKIAAASHEFANGAEKAALMSDLLGKGWVQFIKAFGGGAQAMDDGARASRELGAALSDLQLAELATMDDKVDDLTTAWTRFGGQIGSFVAPAVTAMTTLLIDATAKTTDMIAKMKEATKEGQSLFSVLARGILGRSQVPGTEFFGPNLQRGAAADTRPKPPPMVDTAKLAQAAKAAANAQLKEQASVLAGHMKLLDDTLALDERYNTNSLTNRQSSDALALTKNKEFLTSRLVNETQSADAVAMIAESTAQLQANIARGNYETHLVYAGKKYALLKGDTAAATAFAEESAAKQTELFSKVQAADNAVQAVKINNRLALNAVEQQMGSQALANLKTLADAELNMAQARFNVEFVLSRDIDGMRAAKMRAINADAEVQLAVAGQTAQQILAIQMNAEAQRMQVAQQFPTFWEGQMQQIVASSAFSVAQIIGTWTGGLANAIVNGGNFIKAAWQATQIAIVQGALNTGVQLAAQWAMTTLFGQKENAAQLIAHTATEKAKTVATAVGEKARLVIMLATNKAVIAGTIASITAIGLVGKASLAVMGVAVGLAVGVMSAMAAALAAGVITAPLAIPVAAAATQLGIVGGAAIVTGGKAMALAIGASLAAATAALATPFAHGGIVTGPTLALVGEAGPEAVLPLNGRGGSFMRQQGFGGGGGGEQTIVVTLDEAVLLRTVLRGFPRYARLHAGGA